MTSSHNTRRRSAMLWLRTSRVSCKLAGRPVVAIPCFAACPPWRRSHTRRRLCLRGLSMADTEPWATRQGSAPRSCLLMTTDRLAGHHGDTSSMYLCGDVSPEARRLCAVTKAALDAAIAECGPGVRFSRIGAVVSKLAKREKCAPKCGLNAWSLLGR